jgi:hypothetical protein
MHNFSNIPASSAYGVNFSQPIRCAQYSDQSSVADTKMLEQGYIDLDLNHRYTNSTVVMTIWLTVTKYANLKWQWIFFFSRILFSLPYHRLDFYRTWFWLSSLGPLVYFSERLLNCLAFQYFDIDRTWWQLFQKRVVCTHIQYWCIDGKNRMYVARLRNGGKRALASLFIRFVPSNINSIFNTLILYLSCKKKLQKKVI